MLSYPTLLKVADLFKAIAATETQAEVVRQVLCEKSAFEPYSAFQRVAHMFTTITNQRLLAFMAENDIHISGQDACYLIRLFDINGDGKLTYTEFLNAVLPRTDEALRKEVIARRSQPLEQDEGLSYQIEHALARIFEEELEAHKDNEMVRQELSECQDFTVMDAFRAIDAQDQGYITAKDVATFMQKAELPFTEAQLQAFMARVDKNCDGVIKYSEFLAVFNSLEVTYNEERESGSPIKYGGSPQKPKKVDQIYNTYSSPSKHQSPAKLQSPVESFYSPTSTKASAANNSYIYKTPVKSAQRLFDNDASAISEGKTQGSYYQVNMSPKRQTPLKPKEEQELVKAIKEMVDHIRCLESLKNSLAVKKDFNTYNAFAVFDNEKQGMINARQLEQGLHRVGLHTSKSEVALLMKRLDTNVDGIVTFGDFIQVVTPKASEFAKLLSSKEPYYISDLEDVLEAFTEETREEYKTYLKTLVEQEALFESIRQRLLNRKFFNLHDAYKVLDRYDNGFITAEQFRELLEENGIFFAQRDLNTLVERYAKASKGKVSYYDFIRELTPKSVDKY